MFWHLGGGGVEASSININTANDKNGAKSALYNKNISAPQNNKISGNTTDFSKIQDNARATKTCASKENNAKYCESFCTSFGDGCQPSQDKQASKIRKINRKASLLSILFALVLVVLGIFVGSTYSAFSSKATAIGAISFSIPPTGTISTQNLFATTTQTYLGIDTSGKILDDNSNKFFKLSVLNTGSESDEAYLKIEMIFYKSTNVFTYNSELYYDFVDNETTSKLYFVSANYETNTTFTFISGTSSTIAGKISKYSSIFLDEILGNICATAIANDVIMELKATVSCNSDYSVASSASIFFNINAICESTVSETVSGNGAIVASSDKVIIGDEVTYIITPNPGYTATRIVLNGTSLSASEIKNALQNGLTFIAGTTITIVVEFGADESQIVLSMYSTVVDSSSCVLTDINLADWATAYTLPKYVNFNTTTGLVNDFDYDGTKSGISGWYKVVGVNDGAFVDCPIVDNISFDSSYISIIGMDSFTGTTYYNNLLSSASGGVISIYDILLKYTTSATTLDLSSTTYRVIGRKAFENQTTLTNVIFGSITTAYNDNIFYGCNNLVYVDMTNVTATYVATNSLVVDSDYPLAVRVCETDTLFSSLYTSLTVNYDISFSTISSDYGSPYFRYNFYVDDNTYAESSKRAFFSYDENYTQISAKYNDIKKFVFVGNVAPKFTIDIALLIANYKGQSITESLSCYYYDENDNKVTNFATPGETKNYYDVPYTANYSSILPLNYAHIFNFSESAYAPCFTADSKIQLADGSYKLAGDIEYDDLLLCYNFDEGKFAQSYPVWITKELFVEKYALMEFEDGSVFKSIVSHRIYSVEENQFSKTVDSSLSKIGHTFLKLAVDSNGNALTNANGEFYHITSKCTNITIIEEEVQVINIVTTYQLNNYINGYLGSTGFSNMYSFTDEDENMHIKYNEEEVNERQNGTDTMYTFDDFAEDDFNISIFQGWRIAELKGVRTIDAIKTYIYSHYSVVYTLPTDENGNRIYAVSSSNGDKQWIIEGQRYTLPNPTEVSGKTFKGWYNNADGKYYQAGDEVIIYVGSHFTAVWQ